VHELALAEAVVATALEAADDEGLERIRLVEVRVGELQRVKPEVFELCLQEVLPPGEPRLAGASFRLEVEPARFRCRPCGHAFGLASTGGPGSADEAEAIHFLPELARAFLGCPSCRSPDFEVLAGRGVSIESIQGD
jgi:hydrogenase nickel insertion protein HypA